MSKIPLWKEAIVLREEYYKRGIEYVYNQRNKNVYLSILNAPYIDPTYMGEGCKLTEHLIVYGGVIASRNIDEWEALVKKNYKEHYKENSTMLAYLA
jgi:hypothetical protein